MTILAILWTLAGLWVLAEHDPKRRRVFRLPPSTLTMKRSIIWGITLLPGLLCALFLNTVSFTLWAAMVCTVGWVVVAIPPEKYARIVSYAGQLRRWFYA
ncbi:MAG: hypothetical protein ABJ327_07195 [Litoreibacter sp.]